MKLLPVVYITILLVVFAATPIAAHEQEPTDQPAASTCSNPEVLTVPPTGPEHDLFHQNRLAGSNPVFTSFYPSDNPSLFHTEPGSRCHDDVVQTCAVCIEYAQVDPDREPNCIRWRYYRCVAHEGHCSWSASHSLGFEEWNTVSEMPSDPENFYTEFVQNEMWRQDDIRVILPTDPEHDLYHEAIYTGIFMGMEVVPLHPPESFDTFTGDGCHKSVPIHFCRYCAEWVDVGPDREPVCARYHPLRACVWHAPHCNK